MAAAGGAAPAPPAAPTVIDSLPPRFDSCESAACTKRLKVIATALDGPDWRLMAGAVRNSEIARDVFPDWQFRVYIRPAAKGAAANQQVPQEVIERLRANGAAVVRLDAAAAAAGGVQVDSAMWPLAVVEDAKVERFVLRDVGSRLGLRDRAALDDWESSKLPFHVMRDHVTHTHAVMGGMWGAVKGPHLAPIRSGLKAYSKGSRQAAASPASPGNSSAVFLQEVVWPAMTSSKGIRQHDSYTCRQNSWQAVPGNITGFPIARAGAEFVGAQYSEQGAVSVEDAREFDLNPEPPACAPPPAPAGARLETWLSAEGQGVASPSAPAPGAAGVPPAAAVVGRLLVSAPAPGGRAAPAAAAAAASPPALVAYELRDVFVDAAAECPGGAAPAPPVLFNHKRVYRFGQRRYRKCAAPVPAAVQQYDGHFHHPSSPELLTKDGRPSIDYYGVLMVVDALHGADNDERFVVAERLPAFVYALSRLPANGKLLLRDDLHTDMLMEAAVALAGTKVTWLGAPVPPEQLHSWRDAPWAAPHRPAPALMWARRAVVLASDAPPLVALPVAGEHSINARIAAGSADAILARLTHMLHSGAAAAPPPPPAQCIVAPLSDAAAAEQVPAPAGWEVEAAADAAGADEHVRIVQSAAAVMTHVAGPSIYLPHVRRGAVVFWIPRRGSGARGAEGDAWKGAPLACGAGAFRCVLLSEDRRSRAEQVAAALAGAPCERVARSVLDYEDVYSA